MKIVVTILTFLLALSVWSTDALAQAPSYELELSDTTIEAGQTVRVFWTRDGSADSEFDWIGLFGSGDRDRNYLEFRYLDDAFDSGFEDFEIDELGEYEVRVFLDNSFDSAGNDEAFSVRVAGASDYELRVVDRSINAGESVEADWDAPAGRTTEENWIGLYREGDRDRSYQQYRYLSDTQDSGSVSFEIERNGEYQLRMFVNNEFTRVAESPIIQVGPRTDEDEDYSLRFVDDEIGVGEEAEIAWTAPIDRSRQDWIGVFRDGARDEDYLEYFYLGSRFTEGVVSLELFEAGRYEARLFEDNTFDEILEARNELEVSEGGSSAQFSLQRITDPVITGRSVRVAWEKPGDRNNRRDWIGVYVEGAADDEYLSYTYLPRSQASGEVEIDMPFQTGRYELRMFLDNDFVRVASDSPFDLIEDPDFALYSVSANEARGVAGQRLSANFTAPDGADLEEDWIGLYRVGASDRSYRQYVYTNELTSGTVRFTIDSPGTYEYRYYKNNGFELVDTSASFEVLSASDAGFICVGENLAEVTNFPNNDGPVIAFGDSLTFGVGASVGQDYVSELERRLGVPIVNAGVSGDTTVDALARLESDVLFQSPATVLVWLGGNDEIRRQYEMLRLRASQRERLEQLDEIAERLGYDYMSKDLLTRDETFENLTEIVTRIQGTGAEVILIGLDADLFFNEFKRGYRRVAANTGSWYVEDVLDNIATRPSLMSDLVHPNDAGYEIVADRVETGLSCLLRNPTF